jgi:hypothetical protein
MSEQAEKTRKVRAKRWTESEGREVLRELQESGLSAVKFAAQRGFSAARLSYWQERLGQKAVGDVSFVSVPLSSQPAVELEHRGVTVRLGTLGVDELARLVVEIARRASGC